LPKGISGNPVNMSLKEQRSCRSVEMTFAGILIITSFVAPAQGTELPDVVIEVGKAAPEFEAKDDKGDVWKSSEHVGKKIVVVYFYPADLTGGCTKQACGFRDHHAELKAAGVEVIGVSGDSMQNHQLFRKVHALNFPLLADENGTVAKAFGVPLRDGATITRSVDGVEAKLTRGVTASRWTFVIGLDGNIIHKNTTVKAEKDCESVLKIAATAAAKEN
jgi:thioredoxin-dependent peroxiredoxin